MERAASFSFGDGSTGTEAVECRRAPAAHPGRIVLRFLTVPTERKRDEHGNLSCSFCGKSQKEVKKLIAGPTVYICDECIGLCNDIIAEEIEKEEQSYGLTSVPKPAEVKNVLDEYVIGQERAKKILAVAGP